MRTAFIAMALVTLAACSQPQPAPTAEAATTSAEAEDVAGGDTIQGPFAATSTTSISITGDMSFSNEQVSFMNGILVRTSISRR